MLLPKRTLYISNNTLKRKTDLKLLPIIDTFKYILLIKTVTNSTFFTAKYEQQAGYVINPLNVNLRKWSNTLKPFVEISCGIRP